MNRTHGSCRGSWDSKMLRHESEDMDLYTDPETWLLQRSLRYKDAETWAQRRGSCRGSILVDAATWIRRHGSCRESWDTKMLRLRRHGSCRGSWDIHGCWDMNAKTWIRGHGSCRGSWDTYGCLYTDPETWILQRSLRYKDAETWAHRRGSCRGSKLVDAETCRGSWDITMLRHESGDVDVDLTENPWDTKMLRHESEDVDLVEDPEIHMAAELWIRQHGSCRGPWDTHGCWDMNPETWILQRSLRHKDVETWIRRCGSCSSSSLVDTTTWIGDMTPAEDLEIRSVQKTQTYVL